MQNVYQLGESNPEQITIGKRYWLDLDSMYEDTDHDKYVDVYRGYNDKVLVGRMKMSHFEVNYRYLKHMSLEGFINSKTDFILADIITWSENHPNHQVARKLLDYIKDHDLATDENMMKGFVVNSVPFEEFNKRGKAEEYMKYLGYDLYCVE